MRDRLLVPLALGDGDAALSALDPLREALNGTGPALLPHPKDRPPSPDLRPGEPLGEDEDDPHDPTVAVLATSGSTGVPKGALLPASALLASASATHDRIGGPGRWLLAVPATHVAGLQVLVRSLVARTVPQVLDLSAGFRPEAFAEAAAATSGGRRYTSLVPTQLVRLLEAGGEGLAALAGFDAVLVGGAATAPTLLARARDAGVRVVTTYGMSETCGGCVYDGVPLDGVLVRLDDAGRISLGGPVVARGYRRGTSGDDAPAQRAFTTEPDGVRWFRTDDLGTVDPDGILQIRGRADDAVLTGGLTVMPGVVEAALLGLDGIAEAVVVGVDDAEWGQRVVAAVVPTAGAQAPTLASVRAHVGATLEPAAAPRQLLTLDALPLHGPGKPDRAAIVRLARLARGSRGGELVPQPAQEGPSDSVRPVATPAQWISAARPRTLPAALAPVLVGTGAAAAIDGFGFVRALLALIVALALQVAVNYANDYSDGIRGTDDDRVGPFRLTGSRAAPPEQVRNAAFAGFGVAAVAGLLLVAVSGTWWLIAVGAAAILAAWFYTGGPHPYGYAGLGEVFVFVFFGLVAVLGTTYTQALRLSWSAVIGAIAVGSMACAILVANNLRDAPTDALVGKRTLAVRLGEAGTRRLYTGLVSAPFLLACLMLTPYALLALVALPLLQPLLVPVLKGARGRDLLPVLAGTGRLELVYSVLLAAGLALSG